MSIVDRRRLPVTFALALLGFAGFAPPSPAWAGSEHFIQSLSVDGTQVPSYEIEVDHQRATVHVGDPIKDGTELATPAHLTLTIGRRDKKDVVTLGPAGGITLETAVNGDAYALHNGSLHSEVVPGALDFFRVAYRRFIASVRGTVFDVDARSLREVTFSCSRGTVDVVRTGSIFVTSQYQSVHNVQTAEQISAGVRRSVSYPLDEGQYLQRFGTLKDARQFFLKQLQDAQKSGDPVRIDAARASLFALDKTLGDTRAGALVAQERLRYALSHRAALSQRNLAEAYLQTAYWSPHGERESIRVANLSLALWDAIDPQGNQAAHSTAEDLYAEFLMDLDRVNESLAAYKRAIAIGEAAHDDISVSLATGDLVVLEERLHDRDDALTEDQFALRYALKAYPSGVWPDVAWLYGNLSIHAQNADDAPDEVRYARLALTTWRRLIGDDTNVRVVNAADRYANTLQNSGRLSDSLAVLSEQIGHLRRAHALAGSDAVTLLNDRASLYDLLRRSADAAADRSEALVLAKRDTPAPSSDPEDVLADAAGRAAAAKRYGEAVRFAARRVALIEREPEVSSLRVANAEDDLASYADSAGDLKRTVDACRSAIANIEKVGDIGRRRLADEYSAVATVEYRHHDYSDADADAQKALEIANEPPRLVTQALTALRSLASSADSSDRYHEEREYLTQAIALELRRPRVDPVQLARDYDNLGDAITYDEIRPDPAERLAQYQAARKALLAGRVPNQSDVWAENDEDLGEVYSDRKLSLEFDIDAYESLALRRPLLNDWSLAFDAGQVAGVYEGLAQHDNKRRNEYLNAARSWARKAVRIIGRYDGDDKEFRTFLVFQYLEEVDMMRGDREEIVSAIGAGLRSLDAMRRLGVNSPGFSYPNVVAGYAQFAEDEQITAHSYLNDGEKAAALLAWLTLLRGEPALSLPHRPDIEDSLFEYAMAIACDTLGSPTEAEQHRQRARSFARELDDEQKARLVRGIVNHESHAQAWDDRELRRGWLMVEIQVNRELMLEPQLAADARARLIGDYIDISDVDIYLSRPADAVAEAKAGLELDASNLTLMLNEAHGYLYGGDEQMATTIYLAHRNDPYKTGTFADAILKDIAAYRAAGVDVPETLHIEALLSGHGTPASAGSPVPSPAPALAPESPAPVPAASPSGS